MRILIKSTLFFLTFFLMVGCFEKSEKKQVLKKITWRKGGMESALAEAKKEKIPLLVYWGAKWCPPCNALKSRVFPDQIFVEATQNFIPVYLDGDTEDAQTWGDKLQARGYPTLMVLSSEGKEIVRLTTSVSAIEMASTLNSALMLSGSVVDLVLQWKENQVFSERDLKMVSNFSWLQEPSLKKNRMVLVKQLRKIAITHEKIDRVLVDRIMLVALSLQLGAKEADKKISETDQIIYRKWVNRILSTTESAYRQLGGYVYSIGSIRDQLYSDNKKGFSEDFLKRMAEVRKSGLMNFEDRLSSLYPFVAFTEEKKKMLKSYAAEVVAITDDILNEIPDDKAQHVIVTDVAYYLHKAGKSEKAKKVLMDGMKDSHSPYYMMSTIAYIESENGNKQEALKWYKQAYLSSKGGATQLQWANKYLGALIKTSPKKKELILSQAQEMLSKHTGRTDTFMGRSRRVLKRTKTSLKSWSKDQGAGKRVDMIFKSLGTLCKTRNKTLKYYQQSCKEYFIL